MILLYHLIFPDSTPKNARNAGKIIRLSAFKKHICWLSKHYEIVSLNNYLKETHPHDKVTITFDDGYEKSFDLVSPFLLENQIPATFFVNTSHLQDGRLLWFVYFNALCFEKVYPEITIDGNIYLLDSQRACLFSWRSLISLARLSGDAIGFSRNYAKNYPLPDQIIEKYLGLTTEQLSSFGKQNLLELGGHTNSHPFLDHITPQEQVDEMEKNKQLLEDISSKPVDYFAYPGGIYDECSIMSVKKVGFTAACAVKPHYLSEESRFELPRVDIYSPALWKFKLKIFGVGDALQQMRSKFA